MCFTHLSKNKLCKKNFTHNKYLILSYFKKHKIYKVILLKRDICQISPYSYLTPSRGDNKVSINIFFSKLLRNI